MAVLPVCENEYIERTLVMETNQKQFYSKICKPSDLVDIQKYINDVLELRGFNSQSAQDKMLLLTEEIGELAKAVRKSAEYSGIRVPPIRNGIPTKRRMIPTSFLHAIRRNVLSVRK